MTPAPDPLTWQEHAACLGVDPEVFFPPTRPGPGGNPPSLYRQARAICAVCPVCADCLAYALSDPSIRGVWGNTTEHERDVIRRRIRLTEHTTRRTQ